MADPIYEEDIYAGTSRSGLHEAVGHAGSMASQTSEGIAEFRRVVRAQPIAMALVMLGCGYVIGRVFSSKTITVD